MGVLKNHLLFLWGIDGFFDLVRRAFCFEVHRMPQVHIVAHGTIYEEINRIAEEKSVDLIVMLASSKPKAKGLSSNTVKVARNSDKPILILR